MHPLGALFAIAGGALLCIGAVLDWSGVGYTPPWDRELAAAGGFTAAAAGAAGLRWRRAVLFALPGAALGLTMGIVNYRDVADRRYEFATYPDAAVGIGIHLVLAGAAVALVGVAVAMIGWLRSGAPGECGRDTEPDEDAARPVSQ